MDEKIYAEVLTKDELKFILENNITITKVNEWVQRKMNIGKDMTFEMSEKYSDYLNKLEEEIEGGLYEETIQHDKR